MDKLYKAKLTKTLQARQRKISDLFADGKFAEAAKNASELDGWLLAVYEYNQKADEVERVAPLLCQ